MWKIISISYSFSIQSHSSRLQHVFLYNSLALININLSFYSLACIPVNGRSSGLSTRVQTRHTQYSTVCHSPLLHTEDCLGLVDPHFNPLHRHFGAFHRLFQVRLHLYDHRRCRGRPYVLDRHDFKFPYYFRWRGWFVRVWPKKDTKDVLAGLVLHGFYYLATLRSVGHRDNQWGSTGMLSLLRFLAMYNLNWTELNWTELNWTELNWTELNWTELNWNVKLNKQDRYLLFSFIQTKMFYCSLVTSYISFPTIYRFWYMR